MTVFLVFGLFVVIVAAHNITYLEVPQYGDPRRDANLVCHYVNEKDDPPLHSVKWYRDNNEIFRFTPGQQPTTRTFNTTAAGISRGSCNIHSCSISVVLPRKYNTRISFTCEVSTEGPRFAVVNQTKYLTVAVTIKEDPVITGASGSVQLGEEVLLNCSTKPAMPPANIVWYIDGRPEKNEHWMSDNTEVSSADDFGLRSSWRPLKVRVTTVSGYIAVQCEAIQPIRPLYTRSSNTTLNIARTPHLSMYTASVRVARLQDQRWTKSVTTWKGPTGKRKRGRPRKRWEDEIIRTAGSNWIQTANSREDWQNLEEAFTCKRVLAV